MSDDLQDLELSWEKREQKRIEQLDCELELKAQVLEEMRAELADVQARQVEQNARVDRERAQDAEFRDRWLEVAQSQVDAIEVLARSIAALAEATAK